MLSQDLTPLTLIDHTGAVPVTHNQPDVTQRLPGITYHRADSTGRQPNVA